MSEEGIIKGELYSWGWNNGQLGLPLPLSKDESSDNENVCTPQKIPSQPEVFQTKGIKLMACGAGHNVVVTADDQIFVFGRNQNGQLGLGHRDTVIRPTGLDFEEFSQEGNQVVAVGCGDRHTVFVTKKGLVYACGANFNGQLGLGHNSDRQVPTLLKYIQHLHVKDVACGSRHTILMLEDGTLYSTGHGLMGQLGIGSNQDVNIPLEIETSWKALSIDSKESTTVALSTNFEVYMWGGMEFRDGIDDTNHPERANIPRFVTGNICGRRIRSVHAAPRHCYARTSDGSLFGWGYSLNDMGYIRHLPSALTEYGTFKEDDELTEPARMCKARNPILDDKHIVKCEGKPSDPSFSLAPSSTVHPFTLYKNSFLPAVTGVSTTSHCTFCVLEDGRVMSFGRGDSGELGAGLTVTLADYPTEIDGIKVKKLASGCWHVLAIV